MLTASGRVHVDGIIEFPEDWKDKIDADSIVIQLTAIATAQEASNWKKFLCSYM